MQNKQNSSGSQVLYATSTFLNRKMIEKPSLLIWKILPPSRFTYLAVSAGILLSFMILKLRYRSTTCCYDYGFLSLIQRLSITPLMRCVSLCAQYIYLWRYRINIHHHPWLRGRFVWCHVGGSARSASGDGPRPPRRRSQCPSLNPGGTLGGQCWLVGGGGHCASILHRVIFYFFFQCGTDEWTGRDCLGKCCFIPVTAFVFVLLHTCGYTVSVDVYSP